MPFHHLERLKPNTPMSNEINTLGFERQKLFSISMTALSTQPTRMIIGTILWNLEQPYG